MDIVTQATRTQNVTLMEEIVARNLGLTMEFVTKSTIFNHVEILMDPIAKKTIIKRSTNDDAHQFQSNEKNLVIKFFVIVI